MKRVLSEKKVLRKLGIDDFRHLTKDKVIAMASILDKMDPEVAKKALDQFPEFSANMKESLAEYEALLGKAMETNTASVQNCYDVCRETIKSCQTILENEELTFDQKETVLSRMFEVVRMMSEKDTENKKFVLALVAAGLVATGLIAVVSLGLLGGYAFLESDN